MKPNRVRLRRCVVQATLGARLLLQATERGRRFPTRTRESRRCFASRMLNGQAPLVFEDGEQQRDFVSVRDIVQANLLAMERSESNGEVINIGSGHPIKIKRVVEILPAALGRDAAPVITQKYRAGDIRHCFADISKADGCWDMSRR